MLRGLAAGVALIALVMMAGSRLLLPPDLLPGWILTVAFGAAALFAVAATVTLFAVEREVGSTVFLEVLPQNSVAMFVGKLLAAVVMTLGVLGGLLAVTYTSGTWPSSPTASVIASQGFLAIGEALVYGLLASLLCPQPLLAALIAIAATSFSAQLAMALTVPNAHGFTLQDYQNAVPGRVALVALVAGADVWLGLRWLQSLSAPRSVRHARTSSTTTVKRQGARSRRLGMFGRLLWQSIRQSWKATLAATVIGLGLMFTTELVSSGLQSSVPVYREHVPLSILFLPALFGALTFRADQRRLQYRFLAKHAGRPRMMWLSRQLTWLTPTVAWCLFVHVGAWLYGGSWFLESLRRMSWANYTFGIDSNGQWTVAMQLKAEQGLNVFLHVTLVFWMASLAAYALGQFLSLVLRSDVFAGLLALGGSIVILLWSYVSFAWQLSPVWFIAPLAIGLAFASWFRVPDWLVDRHGLGRWALPGLAAITPAVVAICCVPVQRAAQVHQLYPSDNLNNISIKELADRSREFQQIGREVADAYTILGNKLEASDFAPDEQLDRQLIDLSLTKCQLPEEAGLGGSPLSSRIERILQYALSRSNQLRTENLAASLDLLLAARRIEAQRLLGQQLWDAWERRQDLPETDAAQALVDWSTTPGQTTKLFKRALDELGEINRNWPNPSAAVMNHYLLAQAVIRGETAPGFLRDDNPDRWDQWLPYLANRFPGEASRAEKSLDILAACALDYVAGIQTAVSQLDLHPEHRLSERLCDRLVHSDFEESAAVIADGLGGRKRLRQRATTVAAAQTSYLAAEEFVRIGRLPLYAQNWVADLAMRRAERVRLALVAYHLEHGEYPDALEQLTPAYLGEWEISDPCAAGPFQYRPQGFELGIVQSRLYIQYPEYPDWHPPHTPVLWSVGPLMAVPAETIVEFAYSETGERVFAERESLDERGEPTDVEIHSEAVMMLEPTRYGWGRGHFWMPLPIDPPTDSAAVEQQ